MKATFSKSEHFLLDKVGSYNNHVFTSAEYDTVYLCYIFIIHSSTIANFLTIVHSAEMDTSEQVSV